MVNRRVFAAAAALGAAALAAMPTSACAAARPRRSVLVFGGTGQLGSEIVRALLAAGHEVTVFARPGSDRGRLGGMQVAWLEGDATVESDVARAFAARRFDVAVDALGRSGADVSFFAITGPNIARQAKARGVRQLILHSSVGVGRSAAVYPADRLVAQRRLFEAKQAGEDAVMASGVTWTIIRNAVLRDPPTDAPEQARLVADELAWGTVSRRGLARLTLGCIDEPACGDRIFHAIDDSLPALR